MSNPLNYWPGGIPAHIRCHPGIITGLWSNTVKGWLLFLKEHAVPRDSSNIEADFEIKQRRKLVDQWASMTQADRDSYHSRAPEPQGADSWDPPQLKSPDPDLVGYIQRGFVNLIVQQPLDSRNRALWVKLCILLYRLDMDEYEHSFGPERVVVIYSNPADNAPVTPETFMAHCFVEAADFEGLFFADQESLDTGRLLLCDFEANGQVKASSRIWPLWTSMAYGYIMGIGWYADRVIRDYEHGDGDCDANAAIDMELPIIDLLKEKERFMENDVDTDLWENAIEQYAPGYLEMEAAGNGMAPEYDLGNLMK
ncbi:hypothetical protein PFICI_13197 [Pestalotiopsis fici W106-1]|uniref:Uncharacterized protein n=1 Tax=Pestalotiopsis fici (strain W106-1 / CGMCC3.15140) TaxID=1229662 RepID=W3WLH4_PESFW|nr:uncharacterized protein PFICI_13197 [Pestalotiopsis fici W106-1]ETS74713.1 hypothetical protein PFICI_13197 [Pestalotiopsis fici W106-1]